MLKAIRKPRRKEPRKKVRLRLAYRNATFKPTAELRHPSFLISEVLRTHLTECMSYPVLLTTSPSPIITSQSSNIKKKIKIKNRNSQQR